MSAVTCGADLCAAIKNLGFRGVDGGRFQVLFRSRKDGLNRFLVILSFSLKDYRRGRE